MDLSFPGKHFSVSSSSLLNVTCLENVTCLDVFYKRGFSLFNSIRLEVDCQVRKVNAPGSCGVAYLDGKVAPSSSTSSSSCSSDLSSFLSQDDPGTAVSIYTAILDRPVWFRQSLPSPIVTSNRLGFYINRQSCAFRLTKPRKTPQHPEKASHLDYFI